MTDRKKPTAGFWFAATLFVVLVVYPLSQGPYRLIYTWIPDPPRSWISFVYAPVGIAVFSGPDWFAKLYLGYLRIWNPSYAEAMELTRDYSRARAEPIPMSPDDASYEMPEPDEDELQQFDDPVVNPPSTIPDDTSESN